MRIGKRLAAVLAAVAAAGMWGGCAARPAASSEHSYMEVTHRELSMFEEREIPRGKLVVIQARAVGLVGPWNVPPSPPYRVCQAEFDVAKGSVPHAEWADRVLVNFQQGGHVSHLLMKSLRVRLVFTEKGEFVAVER